jgi:hypothetical protein
MHLKKNLATCILPLQKETLTWLLLARLEGQLAPGHFTCSAKTNVLDIHAFSYAEQHMEHAVRSGLTLMHSCMYACR